MLRFNFIDGDYSKLDPSEIATSLSRLNRYGGRGAFPLSVAQHSVILSSVVPKYLRKAALIHDIPEIWTGEVPSPVKVACPCFQQIEEQATKTLFASFGVPITHMTDLSYFDRHICNNELAVLFPDDPDAPDWKRNSFFIPTIREVSRARAARMWLETFTFEFRTGTIH